MKSMLSHTCTEKACKEAVPPGASDTHPDGGRRGGCSAEEPGVQQSQSLAHSTLIPSAQRQVTRRGWLCG